MIQLGVGYFLHKCDAFLITNDERSRTLQKFESEQEYGRYSKFHSHMEEVIINKSDDK